MVTLPRVFGRRASYSRSGVAGSKPAEDDNKRRKRLSLFVLGNASKTSVSRHPTVLADKSPTTSTASSSISSSSSRPAPSHSWEHEPRSMEHGVAAKRSVSSMTDYARHSDSASAALSVRTPSMSDSLFNGLPPPPQRPHLRRFGTSGSTQYESLEEEDDEEEERQNKLAIAALIQEGQLCRERQAKKLAERRSSIVDMPPPTALPSDLDHAGNRISIYNRMSKHYGACPASSLP